MILTDDGTLVTMDTFTGLELVTHTGGYSNIFTFNGDQVNIEAHSYALQEEEGRMWLANMRGSKEKVSRKAHVKFLSEFQPLAQLMPGGTQDGETRMWVLGIEVHEQTLSLAEVTVKFNS